MLDGCNYEIKLIREQRLSPYNVILYNAPLQALMACAIATYRDDPRADPVMNFTADLWLKRVLPVWRQVMGQHGGWHEGGEYVGIGIGQAIYELPAMWRRATGEDFFAREPGIRGFLDFLVYRTRPDGTHFRWGDGAWFDRIVPDATPLALEFRDAAAYSLRPPRQGAGTVRLALGPAHRRDPGRPDGESRACRWHGCSTASACSSRAATGRRRPPTDVQGRRQLLVALPPRPGRLHHL